MWTDVQKHPKNLMFTFLKINNVAPEVAVFQTLV